LSVAGLVDRIARFRRELADRCSTHVEETRHGTAFLNEEFPLRYDSNYLWVAGDGPGGDVDASDLAADADRVLGAAGAGHRQVVVDDDELGRRLSPAFLELGWSAERLVCMALLRDPEPRRRADVREVDLAAARPLIERLLRERPGAEGADARRQLVDFRSVLERQASARFFVVDADGEPASVCEAYAIGGVTQIEDVNTLERFRGGGLASAVVLAAADAARATGSDVVFLDADDADWPKELYGRLGFDPVAWFWSFVRTG
jgi:GNAT superfamily N-acetyltransferase